MKATQPHVKYYKKSAIQPQGKKKNSFKRVPTERRTYRKVFRSIRSRVAVWSISHAINRATYCS